MSTSLPKQGRTQEPTVVANTAEPFEENNAGAVALPLESDFRSTGTVAPLHTTKVRPRCKKMVSANVIKLSLFTPHLS